MYESLVRSARDAGVLPVSYTHLDVYKRQIYNDWVTNYAFSFDKQKFINEFYRQHNDQKAFEDAILELVLEKQRAELQRMDAAKRHKEEQILSLIHIFSFDKQKFITDFYRQHNDTKAFEAAILELVLDKQKDCLLYTSLTWQNPGQLFVAQELINKVKL